MTDAKLEDLVKPIRDLNFAIDNANRTLLTSADVIKHLTEMLDIALDELIALSGTDAVPLFFRKQILGSLDRIRAVGLPK